MSRKKELEKLAKASESKLDRKLFNFYKKALRELKKETKKFIDEVEDMNMTEQRNHFKTKNIASKIDKVIRSLNKENQLNIFDYVKDTTVDSYLGVFYDLEGNINMSLDFNMLNEKFIERLVNKKTVGKDLSQRLHGDTRKLARVVKSELLEGATQGKGYRDIAKNIAEQTESSYKHSLRIARTEGHRVQTEATQMAYEDAEDMGISIQKQWISSLDDSTRSSHATLDSETVDIDEEFVSENGGRAMGPGLFNDPQEDINCRCSTITIVNGVSPSLRRDNITKEVIPNQTYTEWKKGRI